MKIQDHREEMLDQVAIQSLIKNIKGDNDDLMEGDDETTASQIHKNLQKRDINLSHSSILRYRKILGWETAYCQMICDANKEKRREGA